MKEVVNQWSVIDGTLIFESERGFEHSDYLEFEVTVWHRNDVALAEIADGLSFHYDDSEYDYWEICEGTVFRTRNESIDAYEEQLFTGSPHPDPPVREAICEIRMGGADYAVQSDGAPRCDTTRILESAGCFACHHCHQDESDLFDEEDEMLFEETE